MSEAVIRQRLIRLSCSKLLALKKSSEGLRRSLHVLTVLKHAHSDEARFEPECSDLLRSRLIITIEQAPVQRVSPPIPPPPPTHQPVEEQLVPEEVDEAMDTSDASTVSDEEDGTSMARKRKNHHHHSVHEYAKEKRHCDETASSKGDNGSDSMSLDSNNNPKN